MKRRSFLISAAALAAATKSTRGLAAPAADATQANAPLIVMGGDVSAMSAAYVAMMRKGSVDVWCYNVPETIRDFADTLSSIDSLSKDLSLARSIADIRSAKKAGKISVVIGWQSCHAIEESGGSEWRMANPPRTTLRAYYELGLRVANLCYNLGNAFGGGNLDPQAPLTRAGAFLVRQMQDMGILVDCAGHTGEQTSLDILKIARRPVVCTHSNVKALNDNPRNTSDRVIEGIARSGGVFGLTAIDAFMNWGTKDVSKDPRKDQPPVAGVARYVDEIDYLMRLVGPDHIGLGPDFLEGYASADGAGFSVDPDRQFQYPREMTYAQSKVQYVHGFENVSELGNVRTELVRRGYSTQNIQKILGQNWMRVYQEAWNA